MKKVGAKGDGKGAAFPLQGIYMFDQMGPVGWIDFSNLKLDPSSKAGDLDMWDLTAQAGVPEPKFGGIGPFVPGTYLMPYAEKMQYKVRFYCPSTLQDGEYCFVGDSLFGKSFSEKYEAGPMLWHLTQYDGGRKYVRDTWIVPPWATPDETYTKTHTQFHSYYLLRLMYPNGTIDEEHFSLFMEKQNGQDLAIPLSLAQYLWQLLISAADQEWLVKIGKKELRLRSQFAGSTPFSIRRWEKESCNTSTYIELGPP